MSNKTNTTWRTVRLGEVVEIIDGDRGKNYPGNGELLASGYSVFLNTKNVPGTKFDFSNAQFISEEKDRLLRKGKLERGDFVLTTRGTIGNVAHYGKNIPYDHIRINSGMVVLRPKLDMIDVRFLNLFLVGQMFKSQTTSLQSGSAQPQLPIRDLQRFEIDLPPLKEQSKISDILWPFDEKIENNNCIIKTLEETAQAIFNEWFVSLRFPGHEKAEFMDSSQGRIPKEWDVKKLEDVADISIGRTPPREQSQWFTKNGGNKKWISIKDMGNSGVYVFDTAEQLTNEAIKKFNIQNIPANTVVLSFKLTMGRVAITTEEMASNEAIAHLHLNPDTGLFPEYIYLFMRGVRLADFGSTSSIGTAVNSKTVRRVPILQPKIEILEESKNTFEPIFAEIKAKTLENQKLAAMRDLLLPRLMSGEIQV